MSAQERRVTQLVVIGASAGGIEALTQLVATLPADFPAPLVVAQHLSPRRPHALAEILSRHGPLSVRLVEQEALLEPGVIYVVPPNRDVAITDHAVRLAESAGGPQPSVDRLFRTAAETFGEDLIAVILSGSGSDGAAGARMVKEAGGTVLIQNPETAAFPGMPLSLAPSMVDVAADAERMGQLLTDLVRGTFTVVPSTDDGQLREFLDQLREESGIDFAAYKQPTIIRRLQRRLVASGQSDLQSYIRFARKNVDERRRLVASFLIKVTEFFRDPEMFDYLRTHVMPELIGSARGRDGLLRFWSAGCATGEEAYSLAMVVAEALDGDEHDDLQARVFATDVDAEAVNFARRGIYPARALAHVPPDLLDKYFTAIDGEYEVKKSLRALVVFGEHDLARRAAFPRTDLILCRNVLIYFTPALQRRALQLFAFSLHSGGYLVLGKSETTTPFAEYFAVDESRLKVFRRIGERVIVPPTWGQDSVGSLPRLGSGRPRLTGEHFTPTLPPPRAVGDAGGGRLRLASQGEEVLLGLPIGVAVVDANYDLQTINAVARRLFGIHTTALGQDFIHLVQEMPTTTLRRAIDRALAGETGAPFLVTTVDDSPAGVRTIELTCYALGSRDEETTPLVAVTAADVTERESLRRKTAEIEARIQRLQASNEAILAANDALTDSFAKLRAENEDLQVAHEEAQAATEEVETLNEEMQATNEELETLNEELQATVEELNTTNDDLEARTLELQELAIRNETERAQLETVLQNIADAVIVVDQGGRIILSNAVGEQLFGTAAEGTIEDERGEPLPPDQTPLARAARGETFELTFTVRQEDETHRTYEAVGQPLPVESASGRSVVTTRDVTERSLRELQDHWLAIAAHELRTPLTALQGSLQLAARSFAANQDERGRRRLDQAMEQVQRVGSLITQLMDATRLRNGVMVLQHEPLDLVPLVDHVVETVRLVAPDRTFELSSVAGPLLILGDRDRLEQALLNLLTNAVNYAPPEQPIAIRLAGDDDLATIEVTDHGPGISASELPEIFDQFHRLARGTREAPGGLGLGLFITRQIVQGLAGTIDVRSTEGEGTTFTIRLPLAPSGPPSSEEAKRP